MPAVSDSSSVQGGATASAATAAPAASASTSTSAVPRVSRKHARDDETAGGSKRLRDSTAHNSSVKRGDSDEERAGDGDKDATDQRSIKQQSQEKQKGQEKQTSEQKVQQGKGIYGKQELVKLLRNLNDGEGDLLANLQLECVMKLQFQTGRPAGSFVANKAKEDFDALGGVWSHDLDILQTASGVFKVIVKVRNMMGDWNMPSVARGVTHDFLLACPSTLSDTIFDVTPCILALLIHRGLLFDLTLQEHVKSLDALFSRHDNSSRFSAKPSAPLPRQPRGVRQPSVPLFLQLPRASNGADEPQSVREYLEGFSKLAKEAGLPAGGKKHVWREGCAAEALASEAAAASAAVDILGSCFHAAGSLKGDVRIDSAGRETTVLSVKGKQLTSQDVFVAQIARVKRRLDIPGASTAKSTHAGASK